MLCSPSADSTSLGCRKHVAGFDSEQEGLTGSAGILDSGSILVDRLGRGIASPDENNAVTTIQ